MSCWLGADKCCKTACFLPSIAPIVLSNCNILRGVITDQGVYDACAAPQGAVDDGHAGVLVRDGCCGGPLHGGVLPPRPHAAPAAAPQRAHAAAVRLMVVAACVRC